MRWTRKNSSYRVAPPSPATVNARSSGDAPRARGTAVSRSGSWRQQATPKGPSRVANAWAYFNVNRVSSIEDEGTRTARVSEPF